LAKGYPELSIEDWREYSLLGCTETNLPHITMGNLFEGVNVVAKIMELVLSNGKCTLCGKQIGPVTGDRAPSNRWMVSARHSATRFFTG